jgi:hypothetical protein
MKDYINKNSDIYKEVKKIVDKYDLLGISRISSDEYDSEIVDIINRCWFEKDSNVLFNTLKEIFNFWFDGGYDEKKLLSMSEELNQLFRIFRNKNKLDIYLKKALQLLEEIRKYYYGQGEYNFSQLNFEEKEEMRIASWDSIIKQVNKLVDDIHIYLKNES